jgi:hypothetical protein
LTLLVPGLLVLYGQQLSRIVALSRDQVELTSGGVRLATASMSPLDELLALCRCWFAHGHIMAL